MKQEVPEPQEMGWGATGPGEPAGPEVPSLEGSCRDTRFRDPAHAAPEGGRPAAALVPLTLTHLQ